MAPLKALVEYAQETRRQTVSLRDETVRLRSATAATRRDHAEQRRSCDASVARAARNRDCLPGWPAWGFPTDEIRFTLVPLDSNDAA